MNKLMIFFILATVIGTLLNIFSSDKTWRGYLQGNWGLNLIVWGNVANLIYELIKGFIKSDPIVIIFGLAGFLALVFFCIFLELWTRHHSKKTKMVRLGQLAFIITIAVQIGFNYFGI